jgi:hypothetical protein
MLYNILSGMFDYCVHLRNKTKNLNSVYYIVHAWITYFVRKTFKGLKRRRLSTYVLHRDLYYERRSIWYFDGVLLLCGSFDIINDLIVYVCE